MSRDNYRYTVRDQFFSPPMMPPDIDYQWSNRYHQTLANLSDSRTHAYVKPPFVWSIPPIRNQQAIVVMYLDHEMPVRSRYCINYHTQMIIENCLRRNFKNYLYGSILCTDIQIRPQKYWEPINYLYYNHIKPSIVSPESEGWKMIDKIYTGATRQDPDGDYVLDLQDGVRYQKSLLTSDGFINVHCPFTTEYPFDPTGLNYNNPANHQFSITFPIPRAGQTPNYRTFPVIFPGANTRILNYQASRVNNPIASGNYEPITQDIPFLYRDNGEYIMFENLTAIKFICKFTTL